MPISGQDKLQKRFLAVFLLKPDLLPTAPEKIQ